MNKILSIKNILNMRSDLDFPAFQWCLCISSLKTIIKKLKVINCFVQLSQHIFYVE